MLRLPFLGILVALACVSVSCDSADGKNDPSGLTLVSGGATIEIGDEWKACESADDCVKVSTSCDGCCGEDAIARSRQAEYEEASQPLCESYEGGVCDCAPRETEIVCDQGLCGLIEI